MTLFALGGSLALGRAALTRANVKGYGRPKSSRDGPIQGAKSDEGLTHTQHRKVT